MTGGKPHYRLAVGLNYDGQKGDVPTIGVKEDERLADEVVRIAKRFGIPVVERPALARGLHNLEIEEQIPEQLYEAVAIVLNEIERKATKG